MLVNIIHRRWKENRNRKKMSRRSNIPLQNVISEKSVSDYVLKTQSTNAAPSTSAFPPTAGSRGTEKKKHRRSRQAWPPSPYENNMEEKKNDERFRIEKPTTRRTTCNTPTPFFYGLGPGVEVDVLHSRPAFHNVCVSVFHQLRRVGLMCCQTQRE